MSTSLVVGLALFGMLLAIITCCGILSFKQPRVDDKGFAHPSPFHDDDPYTY